MLGNYLIGLREGLEASLVVSILVAYLVQTGRRDKLPPVALGVGIAVLVSLAFGALLTFTSTTLLANGSDQETFGGSLSIVAVGFVTWMIFWMRRTARFMKRELTGRLDSALAMGTVAIVVTAMLAVGREGLETALFLWAAISAGSGWAPAVGAALGIATAVVLAYLLYKRSVTLNLAKFFTWTGAGLVVVAAGVLGYGVHDLQEGGVLPGLHTLAFDVSAAIPASSWYGALLKGVFNFSPQTTVLQAVVWVVYLVPTLVVFFHKPAPAGVQRGRGPLGAIVRRRARRAVSTAPARSGDATISGVSGVSGVSTAPSGSSVSAVSGVSPQTALPPRVTTKTRAAQRSPLR